MQKKIQILIVDDEAIMRDSLRDWLTDAGYPVLTAENGNDAMAIITREKPEVAVVDLMMPGLNGLELLKKARRIRPDIQIIIITAYGSVSTAITAMKEGACDYLEKPFPPEKIELLIADMLEKQAIVEGRTALSQKIEGKYIFENMVAKSPRMRQVIDIIKVVAKSNAPVLICGENGTGKETVARAIHSQSYYHRKPFVTVSCAQLPETRIESELFGCEAGVSSGSQSLKKGKFETASGGTLFLDEVSSLPPDVQVSLLRTLEEKSFCKVGGSEIIPTEVRLISATCKDMGKAIEAGQFREDLYYRLSVVNIDLPPLRERKEDIPVLAEFFLKKFAVENRKPVSGLSSEAQNFLLAYEWPGNLRELENAMERAVILAKSDLVELSDLSQHSSVLSHQLPAGKTMREIEKNHICNMLAETGGNCSEAARLLGISRMTLYNKIKAYGINVSKISGTRYLSRGPL